MKQQHRTITFFLLLIIQIADAETPLNILFLGVDDLRVELGCYGSEVAITPNIDQLASEGTVFENAYVQQAVCSASRASFLTGLRPDTAGCDYPYSAYFVDTVLKEYQAISPYFHSKGYYSRNVGKIHHGFIEDLSEESWEPPYKPRYMKPKNIEAGKDYKGGVGPETPAYEIAEFPDHEYKDGKITQEALATLERIHANGNDQPFFLAVGYHKPHIPFVAPKKYWDMYDPSDIALPENYSLPTGTDKIAINNYNLKKYKGPSPTAEENLEEDYAKTLTHAYLACVSFIDAQIGLLMNKLDELGFAENTIIILWSDHGFHLGHQGHWGKTTNFENATRSPLILKDPRYQAGQRTSALVEYVDMYPTLLDLSGHEIPDYLEGTSFKPLLENPQLPWKKAAFSQFPRGKQTEGYAMRTDRFRYVQWYRKEKETGELKNVFHVELYDHEKDPMESINVAQNPEYAPTVKRLEKQLKAGWKGALPDGVINNADNPIAPPHL